MTPSSTRELGARFFVSVGMSCISRFPIGQFTQRLPLNRALGRLIPPHHCKKYSGCNELVRGLVRATRKLVRATRNMCIAHQRFLLRREPGRPFCHAGLRKPHVTNIRWTFPTVHSLTTCSIIFPGWGVRSRKQGGRCRACSLKMGVHWLRI